MRQRFSALLLPIFFLVGNVTAAEAPRVVAAGGSITEIVYALGRQDLLAGADSSSIYPEAATRLPQVGYARMLSAEGVLSLKPTILLAQEEAGPAPVLDQLNSAGVRVVRIKTGYTPAEAVNRILEVGKAIGSEEPAKVMAARMGRETQAISQRVARTTAKPRVLFIYARAGGTVNVAGLNTAADGMITLAGGINAVTSYEGYKAITAEGAVMAKPDVILLTTRGVKAAGGIDELLKQPGLNLTPAGENRRVVVMDDLLLLGFGPRLPQAVQELAAHLHPDLEKGIETARR